MLRYLLARFFYFWGNLHRDFGNKNNLRREHEAALRYFSRAYSLDPGLRRARLDRGILLWRELGDSKAALADFEALLVENPQYGPALLNRAMIMQADGRYQEALADLEAYLQLPPDDEEYRQMALRTAALLRELLAN